LDHLENGIQINIKPEGNADIFYHVPFTGDALMALLKGGIECLDVEHRRQLIPLLTGGIEVPTGFEPGPQG
jgi:hypothetical protein